MKNLVFTNNFESANLVINETKAERKAWHEEERTLSNLLHTAQKKAMMKYTKPLFEKVGLPTDGKLSRTKYLTYVLSFVEHKGEKLPAYCRESPLYQRDAEGKCLKGADGKYLPLLDANGEPKKVMKLSAIKEGTWTLEKLLKAVAK